MIWRLLHNLVTTAKCNDHEVRSSKLMLFLSSVDNSKAPTLLKSLKLDPQEIMNLLCTDWPNPTRNRTRTRNQNRLQHWSRDKTGEHRTSEPWPLEWTLLWALAWSPSFKTLTSLKKESRLFFLGDNCIESFPSASFLSDHSIWRFWMLF